jgi:hypothetical protein
LHSRKYSCAVTSAKIQTIRPGVRVPPSLLLARADEVIE